MTAVAGAVGKWVPVKCTGIQGGEATVFSTAFSPADFAFEHKGGLPYNELLNPEVQARCRAVGPIPLRAE